MGIKMKVAREFQVRMNCDKRMRQIEAWPRDLASLLFRFRRPCLGFPLVPLASVNTPLPQTVLWFCATSGVFSHDAGALRRASGSMSITFPCIFPCSITDVEMGMVCSSKSSSVMYLLLAL